MSGVFTEAKKILSAKQSQIEGGAALKAGKEIVLKGFESAETLAIITVVAAASCLHHIRTGRDPNITDVLVSDKPEEGVISYSWDGATKTAKIIFPGKIPFASLALEVDNVKSATVPARTPPTGKADFEDGKGMQPVYVLSYPTPPLAQMAQLVINPLAERYGFEKACVTCLEGIPFADGSNYPAVLVKKEAFEEIKKAEQFRNSPIK